MSTPSTPSTAHSRRVIELACRAPSVHNTQPWLWRVVGDNSIELRADRRRQLPVSDPAGRNLALSCGAALHHCTVAARAMGLTAEVELQPSASDGDLLARVRLSPSDVTATVTTATATADAAQALTALERRCTDRRRFTSWPIPDARLAHLAKAADGYGAHVIAITDVTDRFRTEALVKRAMEVQVADERYAEEQRDWTDRSTVDGLRLSTTAPISHGRPPTRPNRFVEESDTSTQVVESSDGLVAICSALDDQKSWLQAGEALSALWLKATHDGFSIVPLSQVVEVEETRHDLHHGVFAGLARPQILVRVGWQETSRTRLKRTNRRPLDEVIAR